MKPTLDQKIVVVIGGTSGIGRAIAEMAAAEGAQVTIAGRNSGKTARIAAELGVAGRAVNTLEESSVSEFFMAAGRIDHLLISACTVRTGPFKQLPLADAQFNFQSKFFGPYLCAKHAQVAEDGSITFFSGMLSRRPGPNYAALAGVNAAVEALGRALALELAPVRVNTISPGIVRDTAAFDEIPAEAREAMFKAAGSRLPGGRVGIPSDIAGTALFLMTTPFATGITLDVEGGGLLV